MTDHFGLMLNGSFLNKGFEDDYFKQNMLELGGGYFTSIDKFGKFEIYAGYGIGKVKGQNEDNLGVFGSWSSHVDANVRKFFIQPSLGYTSDHVEIGFTTRIMNLRLIDQSNDNKIVSVFGEPVVTLKAGGINFKGVIQMGYSFNLYTNVNDLYYKPLIFSLGAHYSFL